MTDQELLDAIGNAIKWLAIVAAASWLIGACGTCASWGVTGCALLGSAAVH
jgi:hypothetical protein